MILGDSLQTQLTIGIMNIVFEGVYANVSSSCKLCGSMCDARYEVNCTKFGLKNFLLFNIRNDRLSLRNDSFHNFSKSIYGSDDHELPWLSTFQQNNISILILNRGAHVESLPKILLDISKSITYIRNNFPKTMIIFRDTAHGHYTFKEDFYKPPLLSAPNMTANDEFSYYEIVRQNQVLPSFFRSYFPKVIFWDISHMTAFRSDSHRDPLHYCFPGPVDTWVKMLYNILVLYNSDDLDDSIFLETL